MGVDLELEQPAGAVDARQEEATIAPFSLADLGFTDEEIAALGLDTAETETAEPAGTGGDASAALPFSLEELGLSDEDIALIQAEAESDATAQEEAESGATAAASEQPTEAAQVESSADDSSSQLSEEAATALAEQPIGESPMVIVARQTVDTGVSDEHTAVVGAPTTAREPDGGLGEILAQIEADPENDTLRLAVARMSRAMQDTSQSLEHYRQLIRRGSLLDDIVDDLRDLIAESDDPSLQRKLHRLLGDAFMKQHRVREAMDAYSWTPARAN